jgi:hypothetical protein
LERLPHPRQSRFRVREEGEPLALKLLERRLGVAREGRDETRACDPVVTRLDLGRRPANQRRHVGLGRGVRSVGRRVVGTQRPRVEHAGGSGRRVYQDDGARHVDDVLRADDEVGAVLLDGEDHLLAADDIGREAAALNLRAEGRPDGAADGLAPGVESRLRTGDRQPPVAQHRVDERRIGEVAEARVLAQTRVLADGLQQALRVVNPPVV